MLCTDAVALHGTAGVEEGKDGAGEPVNGAAGRQPVQTGIHKQGKAGYCGEAQAELLGCMSGHTREGRGGTLALAPVSPRLQQYPHPHPAAVTGVPSSLTHQIISCQPRSREVEATDLRKGSNAKGRVG